MMTFHRCALGLALTATLGACGNGGDPFPPPRGNEVDVAGFETYVTGHNDRNRITRTMADADAVVLRSFDSIGVGPAGYKDLIAINNANMTVEVIAQVATGPTGEKAERLLRLTVDHVPLENFKDGQLVAATGQYFFRGQSFAWVTIDGGPMLSGRHDQGLESMMVDFGAGTVSLDVRTEVAAGSEVEISFAARELPFNVVSGAYGGDITIAVNNPNVTATYAVDGTVRGSLGGKPVYTNDVHGLTTSGLFTARGTTADGDVTVEGVFIGADLVRAP